MKTNDQGLTRAGGRLMDKTTGQILTQLREAEGLTVRQAEQKAGIICLAALEADDPGKSKSPWPPPHKLFYLGEVKDLLHHDLGIKGCFVVGTTPMLYYECNRGHEIQTWIDEYRLREEYKNTLGKLENFIILDDDSDVEPLVPWLIKVNGAWGLSEKNVVEAIKKLNEVVT